MAVLVEPEMDRDDCRFTSVPGAGFGGDILVATCHTRAGNDKLWTRYLGEVERWVEKLRDDMERLGLFATYSTQAVLSMDGEGQQVAAAFLPEMTARMLKANIVIVKFPSNCSSIFQPNDLMKMHRMLKDHVPKNLKHWFFHCTPPSPAHTHCARSCPMLLKYPRLPKYHQVRCRHPGIPDEQRGVSPFNLPCSL